MGIRLGEIETSQIIENEFRIGVLERTVDALIAANPSVAAGLELPHIREAVLEVLRKKYPNSGIQLSGG